VSYFFHPLAESEHLETITYYESKSTGLGAAYLNEFEKIIKHICDNPERNPIELTPSIRRKNMDKFPFTIYFQEYLKTIQVLAIAHYKRNPKYWLDRNVTT